MNATIDHSSDKTLFGFWIYIMTDCILFASLFAAYAVLHNNTYGGAGPRDLFNLPFVLTESMILLTSSFTCGLAMLGAYRQRAIEVMLGFGATFFLGCIFLTMELSEFTKLYRDGNSWQRSGFLSAYFTLVGTHGLHITVGLIWLIFVLIHLVRRGFTPTNMRNMARLSLFWHFLDVIWIFIFTVVYLMGVL